MANRREHRFKVTRNAGAAIARRRIVKYGAGDELVIQAAAATDLLIGVSDDAGDIPAPVGTDYYRVDVIDDGYALVDCGGTVTRGQFVTADANGKAVPAAPAAGVNVQYVGQAHSSGVSGGVISVKIGPGVIQGAAT
jgi:hypothetical protein